MMPIIFGVKRSKVTGAKQTRRLKSISSLSFLARAFIFSECIVLTMAKNSQGTEFLFRAPQKSSRGSENGQNFELFYCFSQNLKILVGCSLQVPGILSIIFFGFGPPFGPPKCQNFKITIFKLECSKLQSRLVMLTKNNIR